MGKGGVGSGRLGGRGGLGNRLGAVSGCLRWGWAIFGRSLADDFLWRGFPGCISAELLVGDLLFVGHGFRLRLRGWRREGRYGGAGEDRQGQ